ncbi:MAG: hypothetical protein ACXWAC_08210 [Usitatibacter sp.]
MKQIKPPDAGRITGGAIPTPESLGLDPTTVAHAETNPIDPFIPREPDPMVPIPPAAG